MANAFRHHVWIIDTASATNLVNAAEGLIAFDSVRWVVQAAGVATDRAEIADGDGNVIWEAVNEGGTAQFEVESFSPVMVRGLRVPTLDRGKLYLYHSANRL